MTFFYENGVLDTVGKLFCALCHYYSDLTGKRTVLMLKGLIDYNIGCFY